MKPLSRYLKLPDDAPVKGAGRVWGRLEAALCLICLLMLSDALWAPLFVPDPDTVIEVPIMRLIWIPVYACVFGLSLWRWQAYFTVWPATLAMLTMVGLCYLSGFWSIDPEVTHRRAIALGFTTTFGLYFAGRFSPRQQLDLLCIAFAILAGGSLLVCLFFPAMGVHAKVNAGAWRGLWYEKNTLGAVMSIGALAVLSRLSLEGFANCLKTKRVLAGSGAVMVFLILMSQSKTALLGLVIGSGLFVLFKQMRSGWIRGAIAVWLGTVAATIGALIADAEPALMFKMLGKDLTLTGRTEIWAALHRLATIHPWLGYGYAAFWTEGSIPARKVRAETHWNVPSAHNGWLDLQIQLGCLGVGVFGLYLACAWLFGLWRVARNGDGHFSLIYLGIFTLMILSESLILTQNSLDWALFVTASARLLIWAGRLETSAHTAGQDRC